MTRRHDDRVIGLAALAGAAVLWGCQMEERVIRYKPPLAGLEGAQTQTPAVVEKPKGPLAKAELPTAADGKDPLVIENPDGSKTLISRSGVQLMHHIQKTLAEGDAKLFAEQVLSQMTRDEYISRGIDPREAFAKLKPREKEIAKLFGRMPMGEHSPNVLMQTVGKNIFRVQLNGHATRGLDGYTGFDMILEKGNWKLRWFVS